MTFFHFAQAQRSHDQLSILDHLMILMLSPRWQSSFFRAGKKCFGGWSKIPTNRATVQFLGAHGSLSWGQTFTNESFSMLSAAWIHCFLLRTTQNCMSLMLVGCIVCQMYAFVQFYCWFLINSMPPGSNHHLQPLKASKKLRLHVAAFLLHLFCQV